MDKSTLNEEPAELRISYWNANGLREKVNVLEEYINFSSLQDHHFSQKQRGCNAGQRNTH